MATTPPETPANDSFDDGIMSPPPVRITRLEPVTPVDSLLEKISSPEYRSEHPKPLPVLGMFPPRETEEQMENRRFQEALVTRGPDLTKLDGFEPTTDGFQEAWELDVSQLDDNFFGENFEELIISVNRLVARHFREGMITPAYGLSPFALDTVISGSTCFEEYIQKIARPDMSWERTWDELICHTDNRQLLIVGYIMRILDDQVFSRLLFGAGDSAESMLWEQDLEFLREDGFSRSRLRAATINMVLQRNDKVPEKFLKAVDVLSYSILTQLHPVLTYLELSKSEEPLDIKALYQDIHNTVHLAGWLSVQMRRSDSVVTFDWPIPGDRWEPSMDDVGLMVFQRSRARVALNISNGAEDLPRTARIMIAVCPEIRRYTPRKDGQIKFRVLRAMVGCYWGHRDDHHDIESFAKTEGGDHDTNVVEYAKVKREKFARAREARVSREYKRLRPWYLDAFRTFKLVLLGFLFCMMARVWYWAWVNGREKWNWESLKAAVQTAVDNARRGQEVVPVPIAPVLTAANNTNSHRRYRPWGWA